jgi:phage portal protein BeeE
MASRGQVARLVSSPRLRTGGLGTRVAGCRSRLRGRGEFAWLLGDWVPPPAPWPATETEALGLPPFGRGLNLLANAVASTDWYAQRWDADLGVNVRLPDQPAVLTDPDPLTTPWHYRWAAVEDLVLYGVHLALYGDVDFRTGRAGWLVPIAADDVWILQDPTSFEWWWTVAGVTLSADEVLYVSAGNRSGEIMGRGVLAQYGAWLGGAVAAEQHASSYFAGGALPPAVLQSPTALTQEQGDQLKAKWREMTSTREPVILPTGYVLTPLVSNAEQAQLVQSRQWDAALVAMLLGIPAWKLGLSGPQMTYQNVETADIDFVRDSVDRWARPLSESFTKWLMPRGTSVAWNYAGRMRADQRTTEEVLTGYVGAGIVAVDEARAMIGRPPLASIEAEGTTPAGTPELTPQEVTG